MRKYTMLAAACATALAGAAMGQTADNCSDAPALTGGTYAFDTSSATSDGASSCGASDGAPDVWFKYAAASSGTLVVSLCGSTYDTVLSVFDGCGGGELDCNDDFCDVQSRLVVSVTAGSTYWFRIAGFLGDFGPGTLTISDPSPPPTNDDCAHAANVPVGATAFSNSGATTDGAASCGDSGADVWFRHTPASTGFVTITTCGSSFDTVLSIYDGCGGSELACNDESCGSQSSVLVHVTGGTPITIRVAGYLGDIGPGILHISAPDNNGFTESGDAGDLPSTAMTVTGNGPVSRIIGTLSTSDADMYLIGVCDVANFSASLVGGTGFDSQLFLFDQNGMPVTFDDDSQGTLQSTISGQFLNGNGNYYLAVSSYDHDAISATGEIWNDTPYGTERQPDGPGAGGAISGWVGNGGGSGGYVITLTGACVPNTTPPCVADFDDGSGTGHRDGGVTIDDLLYYLALFANGDIAADIDNGTGTGTQDGGVTIEDLLFFLQHFAAGC